MVLGPLERSILNPVIDWIEVGLRLALFKGVQLSSYVLPPSLEDGNRYNFLNVVFSLQYRRMKKVKKPSNSGKVR
jgi:hypothetical protein